MLDPAVVTSVRKYLQTLESRGIPSAFGVVFGSVVTGRTHPWSDIDLIVVSPRFDREYGSSELDALWETAGRVDNRIEPIPCGEAQWALDDERAIIEIARREGEIVSPVEE